MDSILEGSAPLQLERAHIGVRPWPKDGLTVAGRLPGWDNAYVAVTHSAVTLAPWIAFEMTDDIVGGWGQSLEEFRPGRFSTLP